MKRLILLRHAKSSWDKPDLSDEDRPLAPRGEKAVRKVARWLASQEMRPDLVLCSSALRARQTLDGISSALGEAAVDVEQRLYAAESDQLLERLRSVPEQTDTVLLIAHNPGIQDLAIELAADGESLPRIAEKFPTAGVVVLAFESTWEGLRPRSAEIVAFRVPREMA